MFYPGSGAAENIEVSDTNEFRKAFGSNRTIFVRNGNYVFENGLKISDIENLAIRGETKDKVRIIVKERYDDVLTIERGRNISLSDITFGHEPEGYCLGGVILVKSSRNISLDNLILFGSGVEGLSIADVENLSLSNSTIRNCSYRSMTITDSSNITILDSSILENQGNPDFIIVSSQILFKNSSISVADVKRQPIFDIDDKEKARPFDFKDIEVKGEAASQLKFVNCQISGRYYPRYEYYEEGAPKRDVEVTELLSNKPDLFDFIETQIDISELEFEPIGH